MRIHTNVVQAETSTTVFLATDGESPHWAMLKLEAGRVRGFASGGDEGGLATVRPVSRDVPRARMPVLHEAVIDFMRIAGLKLEGEKQAKASLSSLVSEWESFLGAAAPKGGSKGGSRVLDDPDVVEMHPSLREHMVGEILPGFVNGRGFKTPVVDKKLKVGLPISGLEAIRIQAAVAARMPLVKAPAAIDKEAAARALAAVARPSSRAVLWYGSGSEEAMKDRAQAAQSYPVLAGVIADSPSLARAVDSRESLQPLLIEHTGIGKGGLKRLSKITEALPAGAAFEDGIVEGEDALGINRQRRFRTSGALSLSRSIRTLAELGSDRVPQDNASWRAYNDILAGVAIPLENALDVPVKDVMEASKGDWIEFHKILAKAADHEPAEFDRRAMLRSTMDALESMEDLSRSAILPLMLSTIETEQQVIPPVAAEYFGQGMTIAGRVIIGQSKNIGAAVLEASRRYASRIPLLVNAAGFVADAGNRIDNYGPEEFPVLCEDYVATNGIHIRPFRNFEQMREESRRLKHCVGTNYPPSARRTTNHIFTLQNEDGSHSHSTLRFNGIRGEDAAEAAANLSIAEHRQLHNRVPSPECKAAEEEFVNLIKAGHIRLNYDLIMEWRDKVNGLDNAPVRDRGVSWSSALGMDWGDERKRAGAWEEWRYIIGGRFAKADNPGILWSDKGARSLLAEMNPVAAAGLERRAREEREAAKAAKEAAAETAAEPGM